MNADGSFHGIVFIIMQLHGFAIHNNTSYPVNFFLAVVFKSPMFAWAFYPWLRADGRILTVKCLRRFGNLQRQYAWLAKLYLAVK